MKTALSLLLIATVLPEICFGLTCNACLKPAGLFPPQCTDIDEPGKEETCTDPPTGKSAVCAAYAITYSTGIRYYRGCALKTEADIKAAVDKCPGTASENKCLCVKADNCNKPDANNRGGPGGSKSNGTPNNGEMKSSFALVVPFILSSICLLRGIPT